MTKLHELHELGQSPWIDNLKRAWLTDGHLAGLVDQGVRGVTSNPTIFAKSIEGGREYDADMSALLERMGVEDTYWELVVTDISHATDILDRVYQESGGADGFVSLEVSPSLAHDGDRTLASALELHKRVNKRNLMVKIPATLECLGSIKLTIAAGHNVNVTLIFGLKRYQAVIEAYISGLEELAKSRPAGASLADVSSVASFFVSRVDTEVDRRIESMKEQSTLPAGASASELEGKAAIAQAQLAYEIFEKSFSGPRWQALADRGARVQRPLWASTSTKNPAYPDLYYVDNLIGPDTVDTMPDATMDAFLDHGVPARTVDADFDGARKALERLAEVGIDMEQVAEVLEQEGVASFAKSFDELLAQMEQKANELKAGSNS